MNNPGGIGGKVKARLIAGSDYVEPRRHAIWVTRQKSTKFLRKSLL
jgi:hypothetical protein